MPNRQQRLQIAARSAVDDRSIKRVYAGLRVWPLTRRRVEEAARALGLPLPDQDAIATSSAEMDTLAARIREEGERISPLVPGVSGHDLYLILHRRLRPLSDQKLFIRRSPEGHYVF